MNLYRLDYQHPDGTESAVTDFVGDVLIRNAKTARARAGIRASATGTPVLISRIKGAGLIRPMKIALPDGTFRVAA